MRVTVMRVDDRLIHGQIITRWIDYAEAKRILVLDYIYLEERDAAAMRELLKMGIQLDVRAIPTERSKDGAELLKKY